MSKLSVVLVVVLLALALAAPAFAGQGAPRIERSGEQSGTALQAGPEGPHYPVEPPVTPPPTPTPIPTPEQARPKVFFHGAMDCHFEGIGG